MNKFIVLEGLDGVGKTTLARGLAEQIQGVYLSTPGEPFAPIRGAIIDAMGDDQLGRALFYAATVSTQGQRAAREVAAERTVIMDRYWPSTLAYAQARGVTLNLDALTPGLVVPDVVVLITLEETERRRRLRQRTVTAEDQETFSTDFTQSVMQALRPRCQLQVDISGLSEQAAVGQVEAAIRRYFHDGGVLGLNNVMNTYS